MWGAGGAAGEAGVGLRAGRGGLRVGLPQSRPCTLLIGRAGHQGLCLCRTASVAARRATCPCCATTAKGGSAGPRKRPPTPPRLPPPAGPLPAIVNRTLPVFGPLPPLAGASSSDFSSPKEAPGSPRGVGSFVGTVSTVDSSGSRALAAAAAHQSAAAADAMAAHLARGLSIASSEVRGGGRSLGGSLAPAVPICCPVLPACCQALAARHLQPASEPGRATPEARFRFF